MSLLAKRARDADSNPEDGEEEVQDLIPEPFSQIRTFDTLAEAVRGSMLDEKEIKAAVCYEGIALTVLSHVLIGSGPDQALRFIGPQGWSIATRNPDKSVGLISRGTVRAPIGVYYQYQRLVTEGFSCRARVGGQFVYLPLTRKLGSDLFGSLFHESIAGRFNIPNPLVVSVYQLVTSNPTISELRSVNQLASAVWAFIARATEAQITALCDVLTQPVGERIAALENIRTTVAEKDMSYLRLVTQLSAYHLIGKTEVEKLAILRSVAPTFSERNLVAFVTVLQLGLPVHPNTVSGGLNKDGTALQVKSLRNLTPTDHVLISDGVTSGSILVPLFRDPDHLVVVAPETATSLYRLKLVKGNQRELVPMKSFTDLRVHLLPGASLINLLPIKVAEVPTPAPTPPVVPDVPTKLAPTGFEFN